MRRLLEKIFGGADKEGIQSDALRFDKPGRSPEHPTQKPIILCAKLIFNSSCEGDIVYEPFGGSGSTLIAAGQLNRICYACEIDNRYADVIVKRAAKEFGTDGIRLFREGKEVDAEAWTSLTE
jgi:DNA modification methylase